eukprot:scaffold699_cov18-Tisochrysis_lutea.AAC.2
MLISGQQLLQAVLSRRFRFALRLLRGISGFEGLLSRPMLLQLALSRVVGQAMMPYLRTAGRRVAIVPTWRFVVFLALQLEPEKGALAAPLGFGDSEFLCSKCAAKAAFLGQALLVNRAAKRRTNGLKKSSHCSYSPTSPTLFCVST